MDRYPVPLNELLLAPLVFGESLPCLSDLPAPTDGAMRDLAEFGGYSGGAVRTAMSRLRARGEVETFVAGDGAMRYRLSESSRWISRSVLQRVSRPEGFLLAVFSFASEDAHQRQVVRDTLRYHGFQKLAQNVYINGRIDPTPLEVVFEEQGLANNVFLFQCSDVEGPKLRSRLLGLFDVRARHKVLARFATDLREFLEASALEGDELARRYFYAGPVHYRLTYVEEPPLPATYLPPNYPLEELIELMPRFADEHAQAIRRYIERVSSTKRRG